MHSLVNKLFQTTRSQVTPKHIVDFSPSDPGYNAYVELWSGILRTGDIPRLVEFHLSEVIALTSWTDPNRFEDPVRFRQYRRFTTSVAAALVAMGNDAEIDRPPSYLAYDLVIDTDVSDGDHFEAVKNVLPLLRRILMRPEREEEDYPFFTMALMILANEEGDWDSTAHLAQQLIDDEATVRRSANYTLLSNDPRFLIGIPAYNQRAYDWGRLVSEFKNPTSDQHVQFVLDAFNGFST